MADQVKNILQGVISDMQNIKSTPRSKLETKWSEIVGPKLVKHTKAKLSDEGQLTVWVDQSTLAFELRQRYSEALLKRAKNTLGEEAVKTIRIYVGQIR